ncbi:MAG: exodeoxyribonuclease V subunit gamma [Thermodesulfobacteriota bacterium]
MHVHRSNRTEKLVEVLSEVVARPLASPFAKECIVVQGRGMERWLAMQLAGRLGVWANPDFPFPRSLIERAFAAATGSDEGAGAVYQPETMQWAIADLLPAHLERPAFAAIRSYLEDDADGSRRVQLAARIAATFDQYVVYRPSMVLGWEAGQDAGWQAVLWRALVERLGPTHLAARERDFAHALERTGELPGFPARVSLFGLSTLPPLYVRVLFALSRLVEVHLFVLSPSREYWAEIRSQREILHELARAGDASEQELHLREGNPLLASLGRLGRDFQAVLEAGGDYVEPDVDLYEDPGHGSMLATLQSDVLNLVERRGARGDATDGSAPALPLADDDGSIAVHACHGPMREVEVLHDQLVALFHEIPDLEPREVVVMTPAIDTYAPLIEAVFGESEEARPRIPYHIADRGVRATDEVVDAFSRLLAIVDSRMTATDVLDLLRVAAVRRRFDVASEEVDLLRTWVTRSGIRWGIDAAHRAELGQPATTQNTWRFGLDRLFLGYAMPGAERRLFAGTLPFDDVEGTSAAALGKLAELCDVLFGFHVELHAPRPLARWAEDLGRLLARAIASDDHNADQHTEVREALAGLAERAAAAGFDEPLPLRTVRAEVVAALDRAVTARGFLSTGVTFCELVPMRAIPFRVVCLLGMNGDAFPRVRRPLGFDLMAQRPRRGDRSSREDDRYLFLEALLSARDRLLVTYVGQSIRDNAELPPSVVVSELLDALGESFVVPAAETAEDRAGADLPSERAQQALRERVVVRHPLQPFSPRYFRGDRRLPSYARAYHCGAESLAGTRAAVPPFVSAPLAVPAAAGDELDVEELVRFFQHPVRAFVQRRLLVILGRDAEPVENREPLVLDSLERWAVGDALLSRALRGEDVRDAMHAVLASGALPPGAPGACTYGELLPEVEAIAAKALELGAGGALAPRPVDVRCAGFRITGAIDDLFPRGQVAVQFAKIGGKREIGLWIKHLVLACTGEPCESWMVARASDGGGRAVARFVPPRAAEAHLEALLGLYRIGQAAPLPFFPRTSRAYVETLRAQAGPDAAARALAAARAAYEGRFPEKDDPYTRLVFDTASPLEAGTPGDGSAASFAQIAGEVFAPLLEHREEAAS